MEQNDVQFIEQLVGTWVSEPASALIVTNTVTYNADGTGTEVVEWCEKPEENPPVTIGFNWGIQDGVLSVNSVSSSHPNRIPTGLQLQDRIVSVDAEKMVTTTHTGYDYGTGEPNEMVVKLRKG